MSLIDLDGLLAPVSAEDPCGANLEYDAAFGALERAAQGKPEQQIGSTVVPAEPPDWKTVQRQAADLLARSKDLRVATHLTAALLRTAGWAGFAQGLSVLRGFVERYWDGLHPRLDPDDDNDPTMRVNVLMALAAPEVASAVRLLPLVTSRTLGRFALKDLEIANGDAPPPATGEPPTMAALEGALADSDLAALQETDAALRACVDGLAGLEAAVGDRVGSGSAPSFAPLAMLVRRASSFVRDGLARRAPAAEAVATNGAGDGAGNGGVTVAAAGMAAGAPLTGEISSRDEVLRALDKINAYYAKYEPTSPIPMFMDRCKRLVTMSFVDIVKELVPDALSQVEVLRGRTE